MTVAFSPIRHPNGGGWTVPVPVKGREHCLFYVGLMSKRTATACAQQMKEQYESAKSKIGGASPQLEFDSLYLPSREDTCRAVGDSVRRAAAAGR